MILCDSCFRHLFVMEKKAALSVDFASKKIAESLGAGAGAREVEADLRRLCEESQHWLSACKVGSVEYFKAGKVDINIVCRKLDIKLQTELET